MTTCRGEMSQFRHEGHLAAGVPWGYARSEQGGGSGPATSRAREARSGARRSAHRVSSGTDSTGGEGGNMSAGVTRSSEYPHSPVRSFTLPASVVGLHDT